MSNTWNKAIVICVAFTLPIGCSRPNSVPISQVVDSTPPAQAISVNSPATPPAQELAIPAESQVDGGGETQVGNSPEVAKPKPSLEERLAEAEADLIDAENEYARLEAEIAAELRSDPEYQAATSELPELDQRLKLMRANKSPGLSEVSKRRLTAQNKITLWEREFPAKLKADQRLVAAEKQIAQLKSLVVDLQKTVKVQMAQAQLERGKEAKVIGQVSGSRPPKASPQSSTSSSPRSTSSDATTSDNHSGMVWVPGYTRKNGTHVKGYWRRK